MGFPTPCSLPGLPELLTLDHPPTPRPPRFAILTRKDPTTADELHHQLDDQIHLRHERLKRLAADSKPAAPAPPAADKQ